MLRTFVTIAALAFSGFAQAQVAAIDPAAILPEVQPVVTQCEIVAASRDGASSGLCIGATQSMFNGLAKADPAVIDQKATDLVTAIAPLTQTDPACDERDDEIARAIRLASTYVSTPDQLKAFIDIAETIETCTINETSFVTVAPEGEAGSPA